MSQAELWGSESCALPCISKSLMFTVLTVIYGYFVKTLISQSVDVFVNHHADGVPPVITNCATQSRHILFFFFVLFTILMPEVLDLKANFLLPSSLLLSLPFFHPPASLGHLLRVRFSARLRASAVQRLPDEEEAAGQRQ